MEPPVNPEAELADRRLNIILRPMKSAFDRGLGFTLIELLVVISIIALLIGILLPALGAARFTARSTINLSNLKQIAIGTGAYLADRDGVFFMHSSSLDGEKVEGTKPRWMDYLYDGGYVDSVDAFNSPNLDQEQAADFQKPVWSDVSTVGAEAAVRYAGTNITPAATGTTASEARRYGGYGYNFQYLGNARGYIDSSGTHRPAPDTYHANIDRDIRDTTATILAGDTQGSRDGNPNDLPGAGGEATYVLDPPIGSVNLGSRGNGKAAGDPYYAGGSDENVTPYDAGHLYEWRSAPSPRNSGGTSGMSFVDGHAEAMLRVEIDDSDGDGTADNGHWNGLGNPNLR